MTHALYLAIDLGAGQGTRLGLFNGQFSELAVLVLPLAEYGTSYQAYLENMLGKIDELFTLNHVDRKSLAGCGIASAGIQDHDGTFLLAANLPMLKGKNLRADLEANLGIPCRIANDADAGALAEWSVLRMDLLYWVFGGGWGGAWVSKDGMVQYPSTGWNGDDARLHLSNEPGYALALEKIHLKTLFAEFKAPWERFEAIVAEDLGPRHLIGPGGREDAIRAETLLSGPGRCRLFRAVVGDDDFYERFLDIHETKQMADPSIAGKHISKLSGMRVEAALDTDRLFGKILAHATRAILKSARRDGLRDGLPIALGGKPSYALPYFGPSCQSLLGSFGIFSYLRPSIVEERGGNANLLGAAVLADQAQKGIQRAV